MSLYVKVFNGFYSHRKTLRLRALIGDDAFWVPPRIWAYAAENQTDGCFKDYSSDELAMLIGYNKDASSMLQALLKVGFMDENPLRIHDWAEHNAYHSNFAERAAKAASARWAKANSEKSSSGTEKGEEKRREETSIASSNATSILQEDFSLNAESAAKPEWKPTPLQKRIGSWFKRRDTTRWSKEELKALKQIGTPTDEELSVLHAFYTAKLPVESDYRRRTLETLLNNWNGELDKARAYKPNTGF